MGEFKILLKREFKEKLNRLTKKNVNVANIIFNILLFGAILFAVGYVLYYVFDIYLTLKIGYEADIYARQKEILSIIYFATMVVMSLIAGYKIKNKIANDKNINALLVLPIKAETIFLVKFVSIYFEILFSTVISLACVTTVLCISCSLSISLVLWSVLVSVVLAFIAVFIGSILALPLYFAGQLLSRHFVVYMAFYVVVIALAFLAYSVFLGALKDLLESGQIKFLLNQDFVISMHNFALSAFPCNVFASLVLGENVGLNLLWCVLVMAGACGLSFLIVRFIFGLVRQNRLVSNVQFKRENVSYKPKSVTASLMAREFINILRTPAYSLQYFAIAITLPLLVYVTATLLISLLNNLIFVQADFVISLFCLIMFSLLTNTFCSSNISREGKYFKSLKALPLSSSQVLRAKVIFSLIVASVAIALSCVVLICVGAVNVWQAVVAFVVCNLLSIAEVLFATRMDLNKPNFDKKSGNATNVLLFAGLIVSFVVGGVSLVCYLWCALKTSVEQGLLWTVVGSLAVSLLIFGLALAFYRKGINKRYEEISGYEV